LQNIDYQLVFSRLIFTNNVGNLVLATRGRIGARGENDRFESKKILYIKFSLFQNGRFHHVFKFEFTHYRPVFLICDALDARGATQRRQAGYTGRCRDSGKQTLPDLRTHTNGTPKKNEKNLSDPKINFTFASRIFNIKNYSLKKRTTCSSLK
jgi:hypothetical protein